MTSVNVHMEMAKLRLIERLLNRPHLGPWVARLATVNTFKRNLRATMGDPESLSDEDIDRMWSLITHSDGKEVLPIIAGYLNERRRFADRWIGALTRLDIPVNVLWGADDPISPLSSAQVVAEEIPLGQLTPLEGLGHYCMAEEPQRWAEAVLAFVEAHE